MPNQANALYIRDQMRDIRAGLSQHVREVKQDAHQLTDWKFYIRSYPSLLLPFVSLLAFAMVPKRRDVAVQVPSGHSSSLTSKQRKMARPAEERSFLRGVAVAIAGIAMRSATSFAIAKATDAISHFARNHSAKNTLLPSENRRS
jgi:hypothetical protein